MSDLNYTLIAPATHAHPRNDSASAIELDDGRLFIAYMEFAGGALQGHDEAPNRIVAKESLDGGANWGTTRVLVEPEPGDVNVYNPSLLRLSDGEILFSYFHYLELEWGQPLLSSGYLCRSNDEAASFSPPEPIWQRQPYHSSNNALFQLPSDRILRPVGRVPIWGGAEDNQQAGCLYSDDRGQTWQGGESWIHLPLRGAMEGHVAPAPNDRLLMALRTQLGSVFLSESRDQGQTWSRAQTSGLKSGESMPCLSAIPQTGDLLMVWNESEYDPSFDHFGRRSPLSCALSRDGGHNWENHKTIEDNPAWEFTNIACNFIKGDKVLITYLASPMEDPNPPGRLGRSAMSLQAAIASVDWFYA